MFHSPQKVHLRQWQLSLPPHSPQAMDLVSAERNGFPQWSHLQLLQEAAQSHSHGSANGRQMRVCMCALQAHHFSHGTQSGQKRKGHGMLESLLPGSWQGGAPPPLHLPEDSEGPSSHTGCRPVTPSPGRPSAHHHLPLSLGPAWGGSCPTWLRLPPFRPRRPRPFCRPGWWVRFGLKFQLHLRLGSSLNFGASYLPGGIPTVSTSWGFCEDGWGQACTVLTTAQSTCSVSGAIILTFLLLLLYFLQTYFSFVHLSQSPSSGRPDETRRICSSTQRHSLFIQVCVILRLTQSSVHMLAMSADKPWTEQLNGTLLRMGPSSGPWRPLSGRELIHLVTHFGDRCSINFKFLNYNHLVQCLHFYSFCPQRYHKRLCQYKTYTK